MTMPWRKASSARSKTNSFITEPYQTRDEASQDIFVFIEGFYNRQRLHQSLAYVRCPLEFERRTQ